MDVRCGRCGTEYEFDDALVSERGTTVKCTNCGHQFKVHPPRSARPGPERWVVRTASGRELVYTSLRDLQKGIAQRQVDPGDLLARGNQPPRPLGSIAELEPFFQPGGRARQASVPRTLAGVAPPANAVAHPPDVRVRDGSGSAPHDLAATQPSAMSPAPREPSRPAAKPDAFAGTVPIDFNQVGVAHPEGNLEDAEPPTLPRNQRPVPPVEPRAQQRSQPVDIRQRPDPVLTPTPSAVRESFHSESEIHTDPRFLAGPPSRRARSRWIVALVILGVVALFGATVGREYIARFAHPEHKAAEPASDARVAGMLERGNRLLATGDFEGAKEQFDKASVLAEKDPAVLVALAHLETLRADLVWLQLRLLDPDDKELVKLTHRQLGARVGRAERAVAAARKVAPTDPGVQRARIDVLRMSGDMDKARSLVGPVAKDASQPANAYVLAALDLAEPSPGWSTVIDRLRTATSGDKDLLRARPALIYALARSGQVAQAETELHKVESSDKPHPLLTELKAFVGRFKSATSDAGTDGEAEVATVDPSQLPQLDTSNANVPEEAPAGDFRTQLEQASAAASSGDLDRAERLYNAVLATHPGNTEAMAGLADVARRRHDSTKADKLYKKVLENNPSYLPALVARADGKWDSGDRKGAMVLYRRILEQAGPGSGYGQHAAARIAQGEKGGSSSPAPEKPGSAAPEQPTPTSTGTSAPPDKQKPKQKEPNIDTTDLPGFNQ